MNARVYPLRGVSTRRSALLLLLRSLGSKHQGRLFMIKLSSYFLAPRIWKRKGEINARKFSGVLETGQQSWVYSILAVPSSR